MKNRAVRTIISRIAVVAAALLLLAANPAAAAFHTAFIQGDEAQATTCALGSTSQVLGTVSYDDVTNLMSWNYTYGDNAPTFDNGALFDGGSEVVAHFHGPALPGVPGDVQVGTGTGNPNVGSATLTEGQEADLLADLWYLNIHSTSCANGEIRGQVVFVSAVPGLSRVGLTALVAGLFAATAWVAWRPRRAAA